MIFFSMASPSSCFRPKTYRAGMRRVLVQRQTRKAARIRTECVGIDAARTTLPLPSVLTG